MIQALLRGDLANVLGFGVYSVMAIAFVMVLRRFKSTWTFVAAGNRSPESRRSISLKRAVLGFVRSRGVQILIAGIVTCGAIRALVAEWSWWDVAIVAVSFAIWPFQEWFLHAYLLHMKPFMLFGRKIEPIFIKSHRIHHLDPWEPGSGLVSVYFATLFVLLLPIAWHFSLPLSQSLTGVVASLALVFAYEWVHYLIHTTYKPKRSWYANLWRNHRLHHFKNEDYWYGVTTSVADVILHTHPAREKIANSHSCLTLRSQDERDLSMDVPPHRQAD